MTYWTNFSVILLIVGIVLFIMAWLFMKRGSEKGPVEESEREKYSLPKIKKSTEGHLIELTTANLYSLGLSEEEFNKQTRIRKELKDALRHCNTGDIRSKTYVVDFIFDYLNDSYGFNEENINWVIPFDMPSLLTNQDVFDILLYLEEKEHKKDGLSHLLEEYGLDKAKADGSYFISEYELRDVFKKRFKYISFEDKLRIITQRIYSQYKGFGVIDNIRDMSIDGVSGGVSDVPERMDNFDDDEKMFSSLNSSRSGLNSVWVMYKGKSIHFSFLDFETEAELRRVVQNIYKYNYPGQLSESRPYIINEMHDGSRVTVVRPPFAESWAFFIRKKYDAKKLELEQLITSKNSHIPINMVKYLVKGNRVTAITGSQGSGKTTLLMGLVAHIHKALNLRIQETDFELNLRTLYPERNILSFQETPDISGQDGLDLQKKTDGAVNILGEVATDPVAAWLIQTTQVASLFTLFTHHAKTFDDLVYSFRNSLLKIGMFSNESIAEQQVVSVLEFDIHLKQDYDGTRYVERITECVPVVTIEEDFELPRANATTEEKTDAFLSVAARFFKQQTQQKQFEARNIIEYVDGKYVAASPISKARQMEIESQLSLEDREEFRTFVEQVWGHTV